jgi:glycosyltransferase involved in cell wall biosynthesis
MSTPLVSVIVPNYNYAQYLSMRIDSILNQTFQDFEIILLDDCSTDNSREIIEQYRNNPKVSQIVINNSNTGKPFIQWERGLQLAKGKYAWIAEADDLAEPTFLEKAITAIQADSDITVVKTMSHLIDSKGDSSPHKPFESYLPDGKTYIYDGIEYIQHNLIHWNHCYNASMILFKVDTWRNLPDRLYMNMRYVGDWLFWGMMIRDHKIAAIHDKLSRFRLHGKSVTDEARTNLRARAEGEITKYIFSCYWNKRTPGEDIYQRYQLYKHSRRQNMKKVSDEITSIYPDFWMRVGISRKNYWLYWLYKHTIWQIEAIFLKDSQPNSLHPIKVF